MCLLIKRLYLYKIPGKLSVFLKSSLALMKLTVSSLITGTKALIGSSSILSEQSFLDISLKSKIER